MQFQPMRRRALGVNVKQTLFYPAHEIDSNTAHVPQKLVRRLFEREIEAGFPALASRVHQVSGHAGLAGSGRAAHQNTASPVKTTALQHLVQARNTGGNSLI